MKDSSPEITCQAIADSDIDCKLFYDFISVKKEVSENSYVDAAMKIDYVPILPTRQPDSDSESTNPGMRLYIQTLISLYSDPSILRPPMGPGKRSLIFRVVLK